MERLLKLLDGLLDRLLTRHTLTEIAAVLATVGLAWFLGRFLRNRLIRHDAPAPTNLREALSEGAVKISPFVIAMLLLFVVRSIQIGRAHV